MSTSHVVGMCFETVVRYACSDLRNRRLTAGLCVLAVAVAVAYLLLPGRLGQRVYASQHAMLMQAAPTRIVVLSANVADPDTWFTTAKLAEVNRRPDVLTAFEHLELSASLVIDGDPVFLTLESTVPGDPLFSPQRLAWGEAVARGDSPHVVLSQSLFEQLGGRLVAGNLQPAGLIVEVGRTTRAGQDQIRRMACRIAGLLRDHSADRAYVSLNALSELDDWCTREAVEKPSSGGKSARPDPLGAVRANVYARDLRQVRPLVAALRREGYVTFDSLAAQEGLVQLGRLLSGLVAGFSGGSLANASLALAVCMIITMRAKRPEIGLLQALGMGRRQIVTIYGLQGALVGSAGALVGCSIGMAVWLAVYGWLLRAIELDKSPVHWPSELINLDVLWLAAVAWLLALACSVIGFALPALFACRVQPVEALRDRE
ncbi:MAG: FtsX-like permease family protein [Planctomycetes bacterium]|nr:FtsX-like permease family protein [Planctomycetota bacterium]